MSGEWVLFNGNLIRYTELILSSENRSFRYGDGLFESIRIFKGHILFSQLHYQRIKTGFEVLKLNHSSFFSETYLVEKLNTLLQKNGLLTGKLRLTFWREGKGNYTPEGDSFSWLAECASTDNEVVPYPLKKAGIEGVIYDEMRKPINRLSAIKHNNALIYVLAGHFANVHKVDFALLLNDYNRITEAFNSNVFLITKNTLVTPPHSEGCMAGTMRQVILRLATHHNMLYKEKQISRESLTTADEVFLTNAINGVQWVNKIGNKMYGNLLTKQIATHLNTSYAVLY